MPANILADLQNLSKNQDNRRIESTETPVV